MASTVSEPDNRIVNWYTSKRFRRKVGEEGRNHAFIFAARRRKGMEIFLQYRECDTRGGGRILAGFTGWNIYIYIGWILLNLVELNVEGHLRRGETRWAFIASLVRLKTRFISTFSLSEVCGDISSICVFRRSLKLKLRMIDVYLFEFCFEKQKWYLCIEYFV